MAGRFAVSSARRLVVFFLSPNKKQKEIAFGSKMRWLMVPTVGLHVKSCGRPFCRELCSQQPRTVSKCEKRQKFKFDRAVELETLFYILNHNKLRIKTGFVRNFEKLPEFLDYFGPNIMRT